MKQFALDFKSLYSHLVYGSPTHLRIGTTCASVINFIRLFIISIREFIRDKCQDKASALTYYSLLSVVPVAAMAFGLAKGFGFDKSLESQLATRLEGHEEVAKWVTDFAMRYLENTQGGMIAGVGFAMVLWSVMNVLGKIESSFNDIWKINRPRSFIRKFSDYISLMLVAILFLVSSGSVIVLFSVKLSEIPVLNSFGYFLANLIPYSLVWISFTMLFFIMPNARVKFSSALFGGVIAGTLFQLLQFGYIHFQVGVSNYNAIYGSFAALPLFLVWLQMSWLIVLFGAEVAFAHQNARSLIYETDSSRISFKYKRLVSLLIMHKLVKHFKAGEPPLNSSQISIELKLSIRLVKSVLYELVQCKLLSEINYDNTGSTFYQPAYDINQLSIGAVLEVLQSNGFSNSEHSSVDDSLKIESILDGFDEKIRAMENEVYLKDI